MEKLHFDIAIIGGGPAGTTAAIAASRHGANTILIERYGYLGGMLTAAGTGPQMTFHAGDKQVISGIADEIVQNLVEDGYSSGHMKDAVGYCGTTTPFDPEGMKIVLENMCLEAGVTLLYHTVFTNCKTKNGKITSVQLYSKGGFMEVEADVFIDASADADLADAAGITSVYGRESDNLAQPMTMNARVYGVNREVLQQYISENSDDFYDRTPMDLKDYPRYGILGAYSLIKRGREAGDFNISRDIVLCFETNNKGEFIINMTRIINKSAVDPFDLTAAEIEGRRQVQETIRFLKKYMPGFENCTLMYTGPNIGIRESRKINGVYKLTGDDLVNNVMFQDAITMGGYPIDIHSPDGKEMNHKFLKENTWYSIPYRCLITNEINNLIVTGRCISATHEACASIRVTPIIMSMSQAAGTAAALAADNKVDTNKLDTDLLRSVLRKDGIILEEYND